MRESIVFGPELDERQLNQEVGKVDKQLDSVGEGVAVSFDPEEMDNIEPPGVGGGGGGVGAPGGAGGAAAGVASKIPKPVAGVAAAAALPVALAGGVGLGLLSAMGDASARLQTSANILGTAKDNFFREPGNILDENIVRPLSKDILGLSTDFADISISDGLNMGLGFLLTGDKREETGSGERAGATLGTLTGILAGAAGGAKAGAAGGAALGSVIPGAGTAAGGIGGAIVGGIVGSITAAPIGGRIGSALGEKVGNFQWPTLPTFQWPNLPPFQWPTLPTFEWPNVKQQWGGWPDVGSMFPGWPDLGNLWPGWDTFIPDFDGGLFGGNNTDPDTGQDDDGGGFLEGLATGGRVQSTGVATVHRGELVADEQRLVRELADAIDTGDSGGGGGTVDLSPLESKLDRLHNDLRQLRRSMDVTLEVDKETLGRATNDAKTNRMADTDPTV